MKRILPFFLVITLLFSSCSAKPVIRQGFHMDTVITYQITHPDAHALIDSCEAYAAQTEALLSAHIETSEVSAFNRTGSLAVSDTLAGIVTCADEISRLSGGAFDITAAPLTMLWNIGSHDDHWAPPSSDEIASAKASVDYRALTLDKNLLTGDVQMDPGGIGKGWALGHSAELLISAGASGTLSYGGNIALIGEKSDGTDWRVGVKNPAAPDTLCGVLTIPSGIVAVSGGYERFREHNGVRYHHIIDPATGCPSASDIASAVIWVPAADAKSGAYADALSTALFVLGSERAAALYESSTVDFEYVLILHDGTSILSDGFSGENPRGIFTKS